MRKALQALFICKKMFCKRWRLQPSVSHWFYTAVVRPILTYGALVWWEVTRANSHLPNLRKAHRIACLGVTGCVRSTPKAAQDIMLDLDLIEIFLKHTAARSASRLHALGLLKPSATGHPTLGRNHS